MNILVAKYIFGENYRNCKSAFPEDILFVIAKYAIDDIGLEIIRINATMPNLHKYYLSTYNFYFYSYSKPYDDTVVYNIRVRDTELLKAICDVINFAYDKKPSTSKCKLKYCEKHEIERNVAGEFFINYGIETRNNYVSRFKKGGYVSRDMVILAFILAGYEYKFTEDKKESCVDRREYFYIHGTRRKFCTRTAFIRRQNELDMPPSFLKNGSVYSHINEIEKQILDLTKRYGLDPMLHRPGSCARQGVERCNKLIEIYNLHYPEKDWKQAASLEACGSTMLSINPENLKSLAGGGGGSGAMDVRNFFGAKK
jgi:hypothetical protein